MGFVADDLYETESTQLSPKGIVTESLGGGQIEHDPRRRTITIGGMSHVSRTE